MHSLRILPLLVVVCGSIAACGGGNAATPGTGGSTTTTSSSSSTSTSTSSSTSTSTTTSSSGSMGPVPCATGGAETPNLPMCATADTKVVTVPKGCTPTVDGVLHAAEWSDGACFNVNGTGEMVVVVKYSGDSLYMATSGPPTCGCGMQFYFQPMGISNFVVSVFDDPFGMDGDRADFTLTGSGLVPATKNPNIVTACPGNQPTPIRYEWKIPLTALSVPPGLAGQFQMAITHADTFWPTGLALDTSNHALFQTGEPTWGALKSPSWD